MIRYAYLVLLFILVCSGYPGAARAQLMFEVWSDDDLMNLRVGDKATIQVNITGIAGEKVDSALAVVNYDSTLFSDPVISPGGIIPNPGDFVGFPDPGYADGSFMTFNDGDQITQNGTLFSFEVVAQSLGSGTFTLGMWDATQSLELDFFEALESEPCSDLMFFIGVPEPSSVVLAVLAAGGLWVRRRRRVWAANEREG